MHACLCISTYIEHHYYSEKTYDAGAGSLLLLSVAPSAPALAESSSLFFGGLPLFLLTAESSPSPPSPPLGFCFAGVFVPPIFGGRPLPRFAADPDPRAFVSPPLFGDPPGFGTVPAPSSSAATCSSSFSFSSSSSSSFLFLRSNHMYILLLLVMGIGGNILLLLSTGQFFFPPRTHGPIKCDCKAGLDV
mmetsp:Transcript_12179/g.20695  ORF Transcript_12179/g.20695 Transcript_12179/m.20695 type:complete len:190 (-) Transcript_12179:909-1478(-)